MVLSVVPLEDLPDNAFQEVKTRVVQMVLAEAAKRTGSDLIFRDLRPRDVGINSDTWSFSFASAGDATIINYELGDNEMVVIYGVYLASATPLVVELKPKTKAGAIQDIIRLDVLQAFSSRIGFFFEPGKGIRPLVYEPNSTIVLDAVATAAGTDEVRILGFKIEPYGDVIQPER